MTLLPDADDANPVPPKMPNVSESRSIAIADDPSDTSRSCAFNDVVTASTYALIDCWVAR